MMRLGLLGAVLAVSFGGCKCTGKSASPAVGKAPVVAAGPTAAAGAVSAAASPGSKQEANFLGNGISVALDAAGHPAVAYGSYDPDGDGDFGDSVIAFSAWDDAAKKFKAPVTVDHPGDTRKLGLHLAIDGATIAIAYPKVDPTTHERGIWLATSTDGASFTTALVSGAGASIVGWCSMALKGGVVHLAWNEGDDLKYRTGPLVAPGEAVKVPVPAEHEVSSAGAPVLALDGSGAPAIALGLVAQGKLVYAYWRPAFATSRIIAATGSQNDVWAVAMAFAGGAPRVLMGAGFEAVPGSGLKVATSSDDGVTWSAPREVPDDGGQSPNLRLAFAVSGSGKTAISYGVGGGNLTGTKCQEPKLARSDAFDTWTVCSPTEDQLETDYPSLAFTAADKVVLAFQNTRAGTLPAGVLVYVEP